MHRTSLRRPLAVLSAVVLSAGLALTAASPASANARYDLDWTLTAQDDTINTPPVADNYSAVCPTGPGDYRAKRVRLTLPVAGDYRFRTNTSGADGRMLVRLGQCLEFEPNGGIAIRSFQPDSELEAWLTTPAAGQVGTFGVDVLAPAQPTYVQLFYSRIGFDIDENDATQASATGCPVAGDGPGFELGTLQATATGGYDVTDLSGSDTALRDGVLTVQRPDGTCASVDSTGRLQLQQGANRVVLSAAAAGSYGRFGFLLDGPGTASLVTDVPASYCSLDPSQVPAPYRAVVGTRKAEVLNGTAGFDVVFGLGGDDRINGLGGADVLCGGDGADVVDGGAGNDTLVGGIGEDRLVGGVGNDTVLGEAGADRLEGNAGNDVLTGGAGADRLDGGEGTDTGIESDKGSSFTSVEIRRVG